MVVGSPKSSLTDGGKRLTMLALRTLPETVPLVSPDGRVRMLTLVEFECKLRSAEPGQDFLWNEVWKFRDKVYAALTGSNGIGIVITRYDFTNPANPIPSGEIWFEVSPDTGTPLENHLEDPDDPANKSIFMTYNVHWWRGAAETLSDDPWLKALAVWTENLLGAGWVVYRNYWPLGYVRPSVLWRLAEVQSEEINRAAYMVRKQFIGHILGATPNQEKNSVNKVVQGLREAIKILLEDKKYLTVSDPRGDFQGDPLNRGQMTITLSRMVIRSREETTLIQKVGTIGGWQ
jgi:hypothetical protein